MKYLSSAVLAVVGVIHLLPLAGALGRERLAALYGLPITDPNLAILMRHRAVLFGLLGAFLLYAAFRKGWQTVAYVAAFTSVASFLWIALSTDGYNPYIARVVTMDWIALACLVAGVGSAVIARRRG